MQQLILTIKQKKELKDISDDFVKDYLKKYKKTHNIKTLPTNSKSKDFKLIVKDIRAELRKVYGLFRNKDNAKLRNELINNVDQKDIHIEILETHASTKERLPFYKDLYTQIFNITKKPKTILDLGCGINPFSISFMGHKPTYYAYDINKEEITNINKYFKQHAIKGNAELLDISKTTKVSLLPKADVAFLFKVSAILDKGKGHKKTEEIIDAIPSTYVVVSFPTLTMSGKPMTAPRRSWMEWLCKRRNWDYSIIEFKNEIYYVLKK
ncbi:hypothetical protein HOD05_03610 [Candidatus Woesearchaeota archaeon]|jgi:16S rRNA (guanine(1405)-N(7))-methyltransferase|nr:hypothetical protein [Candidatus Woesearchaeota archaeon]MBT4150639.1 hypothetical protein [Candidatus Woesearchaeota archaeon]MBT4247857.1 hypothetical protein [Candidatus Woesearchaeota archaeon]MBT4434281.1 hypothetical protein [Candidatus Woesearchaeota archaeon]MBT7331890.1 hypothetical protein [Candidatus Woesearchaeota archaeon]